MIDQKNVIQNYFEKQVLLTPNKIAVQFKNETITYSELNKKSNSLAHFIRERNISTEDKVIINVDRSINLVVSLLGVLKSGAAYVPVNSKYPKNRLNYICNDVQPKLIITSENNKTLNTLNYININDFDFEEQLDTNLELITNENNLAYIIYTSGSTGRPKGVMVEHKNTCHFILWAKKEYEIKEDDVVVAFAPIIFDLSIFEIFAPLISGAKLIIAQKPYDIFDRKLLNEVTIMSTVPSAFRSLTAFQKFFEDNFELPKLSKFNFAGEIVDKELINRVYEKLNPDVIYNCYGPTETTTYATVHPFKKNRIEDIYLGSPISPTNIYIINEKGEECINNEIGEIYIGGDCVSRGYLNLPEETNKRFVKISGINGIVYKTGDLGSKNERGLISFHGRIDNQIKIKGHRIELGEIENCLQAIHSIKQACVIPFNNYLIAFLKLENGAILDVDYIQKYLKENIPIYMIPYKYCEEKAFPITLTGKLDRMKILENYKNKC